MESTIVRNNVCVGPENGCDDVRGTIPICVMAAAPALARDVR